VPQYKLPASYDVLPLMARMTARLVSHKKNTAVALLSLQWHVPRELKQQAKGKPHTVSRTGAMECACMCCQLSVYRANAVHVLLYQT
jgi:hypothetical protein